MTTDRKEATTGDYINYTGKARLVLDIRIGGDDNDRQLLIDMGNGSKLWIDAGNQQPKDFGARVARGLPLV